MDDQRFWLDQHAVPRPVGGARAICQSFCELLESNPSDEEAAQQFLTKNPFFLSEQLPHCHHVIPKFKFGNQYVSDFVLPEMTSGGTFWVFVEIEPTNAQLVTKRGDYGDRVRQGLQQLRDWQTWMERNRDYAIRARPNGLGLADIAGVWTWLVVGRRSNVTDRFNHLRQQTREREGINIMTFDRLISHFQKRAEFWDAFDPVRALQQFADGPEPPWERKI